MRRLAIGFLLLLTGQGPVAEPTPGGVPTIVITPDNDERIEKFERRGFDALQKFRDISAARLWLEVAANHDSRRAARALSDTYHCCVKNYMKSNVINELAEAMMC